MNQDDAKELRELCDKAISDIKSFKDGTPYEQLGLVKTFQIICAPLLHAGELDPVIRSAIPPVRLYQLKSNISRLSSAMMFNRSSVLDEYLPAIIDIREALGRVEAASSPSRTGP